MASPQIKTPAEIIFDNTDSGAAVTPSSGQTVVGIDEITKKLYSKDDAGLKTDYGAAGGGGGGSGIMGQDEGVPLGTGTILNVVGDNVAMTISGSVLRIAHTNPTFPAELIGIYGQNQGVPLGTGTILNVVGSLLQMSISGTVLAIEHTDLTEPVQDIVGAMVTGNAETGIAVTYDDTNGKLDFVVDPSISQNSKSIAYTTVLSDAGKHILHPSADTTARTWTIDSNANVPYPIGTAITFVNQNGAGVITIAITSDTMRLAGAGTTGNRTLAANGIATALKITSTEWIISGTGLT